MTNTSNQIGMSLNYDARVVIVLVMLIFGLVNCYFAKEGKLDKHYFNSWFCMFAALITALTL